MPIATAGQDVAPREPATPTGAEGSGRDRCDEDAHVGALPASSWGLRRQPVGNERLLDRLPQLTAGRVYGGAGPI